MYRFRDRVRFSEIDENARMTVSAVMNLLQDCSDYESEELGIGHGFLAAKDRAWVLSFWQVFFDRWPAGREPYTAETRPWKFEHFFGHRNFALYDGEERIMVKANSLWTFIDTTRMRPVRLEPEEIAPYGVDEPLSMEYARARKILLPKEQQEGEPIPVRRSHLDMNHHVNNVQYIAMACEYLPEGFDLYELRAEYRSAAKLGDTIFPRIARDEIWLYVALCDGEGRPYANVCFRERTKEERTE